VRQGRRTVQVKFKRLTPTAQLPAYATPGSAGLDLRADVAAPVYVNPGCWLLVRTGLAVAIPVGYEAQIRPRSGLALNYGVTVLNSPGTIDLDFRGNVSVILINHGHDPFKVSPGDRIAQLVIAPVATVEPVEADELGETERGAVGFGSTGER
jgi:dUTP pyrophosphatase